MNDIDQTQVSVQTRRYAIRVHQIQRLGRIICEHLGVSHLQLGVSFVGNTTIQRLNKEFRGKNKPTDVLSFPQMTWPKPLAFRKSQSLPRSNQPPKVGKKSSMAFTGDHLGDLVISLAMAERNAHHIGQSLDREVCFLMVHGILHLCGHDHMKAQEEKKMLRAQRAIMNLLESNQPKAALWKHCVRTLKRKYP